AHLACSTINHSWSAVARSSAGKSDESPTLPNATLTLRKRPRRLIRLIGEFLKSERNSSSFKVRESRNGMPTFAGRAEYAVSRDSWAQRFHGHASRQSSQPKI